MEKSGIPRLKTEADYRTMTFATASNDWIKLDSQKLDIYSITETRSCQSSDAPPNPRWIYH